MNAGIMTGMGAVRKITVVIEESLLEDAQRASGLGVTEVVREGLKAVAAGHASRELRKMRGKVRLQLDIEALRDDR